MIKLEDLQPKTVLQGILPDCLVTVASVQWFGSEALELTYLRRPFQREPDFGVTSVNYDFSDLLARAEVPR